MAPERGNGTDDHENSDARQWSPIGGPNRGPGKLQQGVENREPSPPRDGGLESAVQKMDRVAAGYEDDGWTVHLCHPGGVTLLTGDGRVGIEVVVPDNELEAVAEQLADGDYESYQVFREEFERLLFFVVAVEDRSAESVVLFAGYFDLDDAAPLFDSVERDGEFGVYLSPPAGDYIEFSPLDPAYFRAPDSERDAGGDR